MVKGYNSQDISYSGKYAKYFWDRNYNPNASITNGLANCTTYVFGACLQRGLGAPVKTIRDARNWNLVVSDDWEVLDYSRDKVRKNDILQWTENHVAIAEDGDNISASWYTGMHGKAYYDGGYDKREFNSLEEMSDWMIENYPYRFYHEVSIEQENKGVGGTPRYILRKKSSDADIEKIKRSIDEINTALNEIKEAL